MNKKGIFVFVSGGLVNCVLDENGEPIEWHNIDFDNAEGGGCPVCGEELQNFDKCDSCGFDLDNGTEMDAIKILLDQEAKDVSHN
jgi:hypothetical protein